MLLSESSWLRRGREIPALGSGSQWDTPNWLVIPNMIGVSRVNQIPHSTIACSFIRGGRVWEGPLQSMATSISVDKQDYDYWRDLGNDGWGWSDLLPYFKKSEDQVHGADDVHGAGGALPVTDQRNRMPLLDVFINAAAEAGIPITSDFNRGDNEGCGYFQVNQRNGIHWSSATAFLHPVKSRSKLKIISGALVERIRLNQKKADGIDLSLNREHATVRARGEVILAAGTIGSPHLLQVSGIGPEALLRQRGIEIVHDLPGVGKNLQEHAVVKCVYQVSGIATLNERLLSSTGVAKIGLEYLLLRRGPMTMGATQAGAFTRSSPGVGRADLQILIQPLSLPRFPGKSDPFAAFTVLGCILRPKSRGSVTVRARDIYTAPAIETNVFAEHQDAVVGANALKIIRKVVLDTSAFAAYAPREHFPGRAIQADEDFNRVLPQCINDLSRRSYMQDGPRPYGRCR
jgi:choline dehydrogenase